jgi:hypothetical protein
VPTITVQLHTDPLKMYRDAPVLWQRGSPTGILASLSPLSCYGPGEEAVAAPHSVTSLRFKLHDPVPEGDFMLQGGPLGSCDGIYSGVTCRAEGNTVLIPVTNFEEDPFVIEQLDLSITPVTFVEPVETPLAATCAPAETLLEVVRPSSRIAAARRQTSVAGRQPARRAGSVPGASRVRTVPAARQ